MNIFQTADLQCTALTRQNWLTLGTTKLGKKDNFWSLTHFF